MTDAERAERVARELVRVKPEDGFACVYIADEFVAAEPGCETSPLAKAFRLAIASALTAALAEARAEQRERDAEIAYNHVCDDGFRGCVCNTAIWHKIRNDAEREVTG